MMVYIQVYSFVHHRSVSVSSDVDWCVCRLHRPSYEHCTTVVCPLSRRLPPSSNILCSFSVVLCLRLRYPDEFWLFYRRTLFCLSCFTLKRRCITSGFMRTCCSEAGVAGRMDLERLLINCCAAVTFRSPK